MVSIEARAKIERLATVYENRVLVMTVLGALIVSACLSFYAVRFLAGDRFDPAKGDRAVITCEVTYSDKIITQVAAWVDQEGNIHYTKETPKFAGYDTTLLVLLLINLGLAKAGYDIYGFLTGRYRRRLVDRFKYPLYTE